MALTKAASMSEVPPGFKKTVFLSGKRIMIANVDGEFFAVDDTCTHAQCSLGGEGFLDSNVVMCGCHGAQYDVTNGKVLALPAVEDLSSYPTKVEGNDVFVEL